MTDLCLREEKMSELRIAVAAEFELCEKIADFLQQSVLPVEKLSVVEIYPFTEEQGIRFNNRAVAQLKADETEWSDFDYLLFAGDITHAAHLAQAAAAGCVVVDMKGICSLLSDVPVVVPTVNDEQLTELRQRNIVCLPDVQVTQLALALDALMRQNHAKQLAVTSLLPASYAGTESVSQLAGQTARLLNGLPIEEGQQRLAFDVFPTVATNLNTQLQKIFPQLEQVIFHCVRVPVFYGISQKVTALCDYEWDTDALLTAWKAHELLQYEETLITPVINGENENAEETVKLHISDLNQRENVVEFWTVADDQRFNLALLTVKLVELIYRQGY